MFFYVLFFRSELNAIIGIFHVDIVDVGCLDRHLLVVMMQNQSLTRILAYRMKLLFSFIISVAVFGGIACWGWQGPSGCELTIIL